MNNSEITILLIDDHQVVREGLKSALHNSGFTVIGEAASKSEAFAQIAHKSPKVIVVDLNLPDGSGLEVVAWARNISSSIGIVVLTLDDDDAHLLAGLQAGASAYVVKSAPIAEVIAAVAHAAIARELEVLALLPRGQTSSEIASQLFISEATVKTHLASIYRKLAVANRTEAVVAAIKHGLAD
jgi:DNA-binding NarL/FixJ family response regulator